MSYKNLKSYQQTIIICDFTIEFCARYINKKSRTTDQMEQAARSSKQNIAEGSSNYVRKNELYLLNIARASLKELLEDYEDFLRQRGLKQWKKDDPEAVAMRQLSYKSDKSYESYKTYLNNPESAANIMICLINQTTFLLDRQIKSLEEKFVKEGDYNEKLRWKREEQKKKEIIGRFWKKFQ